MGQKHEDKVKGLSQLFSVSLGRENNFEEFICHTNGGGHRFCDTVNPTSCMTCFPEVISLAIKKEKVEI